MELNTIKSFFHNAYMPHGHCYLWQPHILWTNVLSDLLIAASYFSIPLAIMIYAKKRPDVGRNWLFVLFSSFILLCGITHVIGVYTVWNGAYGIHGITKALTALISMITAVYLFRLIPSAISIPTPNQYLGVSAQLKKVTDEKSQLHHQLNEHKITEFMLDALPTSALLLDQLLSVRKCNTYFYQELGYQHAEELISIRLHDIVTLDDPFDSLESISQSLLLQKDFSKEALCHVTHRSGKKIPMEMRLIQEQYEGQNFIIAVFNNLSSLKRTEQALADSNARMQRAIGATEDGIWEWNPNDNTVTYSSRLKTMIGKKEEDDVSFDDWVEHIHPDFRSRVQAAIEEHFKTKKKYHVEYLGLNRQGQYSWFSAIGDSQFSADGEPELVSGALRNINPTKTLETQVAEKSDILNAIYDGSSQAIWLLQVEPKNQFRFLEFNKLACERTGVQLSDIIGKTLTDLKGSVFPSEIIARLEKNYRLCVELGKPVDYTEMLPYQDTECWYQTTLYPLKTSSGVINKIVGIAIDITARKKAEAELEKNQKFLQRIIDSAVCGLYLYDIKEQVNTRINKRYTQLLGYTIDDVNQQSFEQCYHPSEHLLVKEHLEEVRTSQDGALIPLKYRFRHADGHWIWCYSVDTVITRYGDGSPKLILGTFVDITEQTELLIELQESNAHLEHFAYIASHDLQEPLRKITVFADSLASRITPEFTGYQDAQYEASRLVDASQRMRTMIQDLLKLSRLHSYELKRQDTPLNMIVENACEQLSLSIEEHKVKVLIENGEQPLPLDPSLFVQVFQNLISNTIKFRQQDISPIIRINVKTSSESQMIIYSDNSIGIPEEHRNLVFEPFTRLNQSSQSGSGIGLALCRQIVKLHQGKISCVDCNEGAKFEITIPTKGKTNGTDISRG
ncbi:PAS domain S-box protein [Pseudoalteromonas sp. T1lg65]|uniref:PAS domain-containing sensor histidine kinase n=1 Tax=Pseudoalteromonas sp. T1lg65 TaxID=2077101 RepID=UPI003F790DEE